MNYEIQQALARKVDDWQFRALEQRVDQQKHEINQLERRIGELESSRQNYYTAMQGRIDVLVQENKLAEIHDALISLKQIL
jgi:predicted  nucleic acid-binding Zn-ribbon protein